MGYKATPQDIKNKVPGKWVDAENFGDTVSSMNIGDIVFSLDDLESASNGKLIACDQRVLDFDDYPELAEKHPELRRRINLSKPYCFADTIPSTGYNTDSSSSSTYRGAAHIDVIYNYHLLPNNQFIYKTMIGGSRYEHDALFLGSFKDGELNIEQFRLIKGASIYLLDNYMLLTSISGVPASVYEITNDGLVPMNITGINLPSINTIYQLENNRLFCMNGGTSYYSDDFFVTKTNISIQTYPEALTFYAKNLDAFYPSKDPFHGCLEYDSNGNVYMCAYSSSSKIVVIYRSVDNGATWSYIKVINYAEDPFNAKQIKVVAFGIDRNSDTVYIVSIISGSELIVVNFSLSNSEQVNISNRIAATDASLNRLAYQPIFSVTIQILSSRINALYWMDYVSKQLKQVEDPNNLAESKVINGVGGSMFHGVLQGDPNIVVLSNIELTKDTSIHYNLASIYDRERGAHSWVGFFLSDEGNLDFLSLDPIRDQTYQFSNTTYFLDGSIYGDDKYILYVGAGRTNASNTEYLSGPLAVFKRSQFIMPFHRNGYMKVKGLTPEGIGSDVSQSAD